MPECLFKLTSFPHHQGEHAEIVVGIVIVIPVVAVQTGIVEVAKVEAVAFRVAGYARHHPEHCPSNSLRAVSHVAP